MPSAREINRRIKSVTNTQQITKAMKMVSSVRLRRAQDRAAAAAPFTEKIEAMLSRLAAAAGSEADPLFEQREVKRTAYIVIGSDKGLAGAFNSNINKAMANILTEKGKGGTMFFVTGRKPLEYLKHLHVTAEGRWSGFSDKPQYHHARTIAGEAVARFLAKWMRCRSYIQNSVPLCRRKLRQPDCSPSGRQRKVTRYRRKNIFLLLTENRYCRRYCRRTWKLLCITDYYNRRRVNSVPG